MKRNERSNICFANTMRRRLNSSSCLTSRNSIRFFQSLVISWVVSYHTILTTSIFEIRNTGQIVTDSWQLLIHTRSVMVTKNTIDSYCSKHQNYRNAWVSI